MLPVTEITRLRSWNQKNTNLQVDIIFFFGTVVAYYVCKILKYEY